MPPREPLGNILQFHSSISEEIKSTQDRVKYLIGNRHGPSDGEIKETVLRKMLSSFLSEEIHVGRGFVRSRDNCSRQIDILLTSTQHPVLFRSGEFRIVTADAVKGVVEVKSRTNDIAQTVNSLCDNIEFIRNELCRMFCLEVASNCICGLFLYNRTYSPDRVAREIVSAANNNVNRVINVVCCGEEDFIRYWPADPTGSEIVNFWRHYKLQLLSQTYFISNIVDSATSKISRHNSFAWYSAPEGKEGHKVNDYKMNGDEL